MKSSNATPPAIAALETNIIFRHRSETSASSSSCASIREISSIGLASSIRFKIELRLVHCRRWQQVTCAPVEALRQKRTATSTMQCIYSGVSKASLQKTGVLLNSAGDFREFSPKKFENGGTGDFQQLGKPAIGGPFCY